MVVDIMSKLKELKKARDNALEAYKKAEKEYLNLAQQLRSEQSRKNASAYQREKALDKRRGEWVKENLKIGDIIKVKGSRIKYPREVVQINRYDIVVQTVNISKTGEIKRTYTTTEHIFEKVTHIFKDNNFIPIKDLLND